MGKSLLCLLGPVHTCSHVHPVKLVTEQSWVFYLVYICIVIDSITGGQL